MLEKIIRNSVRCLRCGDEIVHETPGKMRWCRCGAVAVDGYDEWLRRVGDPGDFQETSIVERHGSRIDIRTGEPADE